MKFLPSHARFMNGLQRKASERWEDVPRLQTLIVYFYVAANDPMSTYQLFEDYCYTMAPKITKYKMNPLYTGLDIKVVHPHELAHVLSSIHSYSLL